MIGLRQLTVARTLAAMTVGALGRVATAGRSEGSGRWLLVTFTERDPRSSLSAVVRHLRFEPETRGEGDYDISKHAYRIYLPSSYDPAIPHGVVHSNMGYMYVRFAWPTVCDRRHLILAFADSPPVSEASRIGLALDAVHNLKRQYAIDEDRVYVVGRLGDQQASILAMLYPDVFKGCLYLCGVWRFWKQKAFSKVRLIQAKTQNRFVVFSNLSEPRRSELKRIYADRFKKAGFAWATYVEMPEERRIEPTAEYFEKCVAFLDRPLVKAAKVKYEEAIKAERRKQLGRALRLYEKTVVHAMGEDFAEEAAARAAKLRKWRDDQIAVAKHAIEARNYVAAFSALSQVVKQFGEAGDEARTLLARLQADPEVQAVRQSAKDATEKERLEAAAGRALGSARRLLDSDDLAKGYQELRDVAKRYPGTRAAAEAAKAADALWADPQKRSALQSAGSSRRAKSLLRLAKNFMANGVNDQARSRLEKIVREYPGTSQAMEAEKLLSRLKGK